MNTVQMLKLVSGWGSLVLAMTIVTIVTTVMIVMATSGAQAAALVVVGGELLGAAGVNVGSNVYDLQIVEGTCVDLYDGCDDLSDFTFTTLADAELAGQALFDLVYIDVGFGNFDTVPNLNVGCSGAFCGTAFPFGLPDLSSVSIVSAVNQVDEIDDVVISGPSSRTYDSSADTFHDLTTYAIWTLVPPATQVVVGGKLVGATNVNVGGKLYDVEFIEGTCVDLYDGCDDVSDFTFTTVEDAVQAGLALQAQVVLNSSGGNFDTVPNLTAGCSGALCGTTFPYGLPNATEVSVVAAVNQSDEVGDFAGPGATQRTYDSDAGTLHTLTTFAVWTPASAAQPVPLFAWPAAIAMLALGFRRLRAS
jgi:hypothetical protein